MYRSLAIRLTALIVILATTATTVAAQRGGFRGGGGVSIFRGAPAVRSAPGPAFMARPAPSLVGRPVTPFVTSPVVGSGRFPGTIGRFPRAIVVPPVIGYGYYSPYIWPTQAYAAPPYYSPYDTGYASQAAPAVSQNEVDLAYQVGRLSAEVEQLRQQQTVTTYTQPPVQTQATPQERTKNLIVLVFRDGHRMEIQNYAIVGQTLWVFEERVATKILLSDLDLDATQRENRGSGLRLPSQEK